MSYPRASEVCMRISHIAGAHLPRTKHKRQAKLMACLISTTQLHKDARRKSIGVLDSATPCVADDQSDCAANGTRLYAASRYSPHSSRVVPPHPLRRRSVQTYPGASRRSYAAPDSSVTNEFNKSLALNPSAVKGALHHLSQID